MGRVFVLELDGRSYGCKFCNTPLALADHILSRNFNCSQGRAYLFSKVCGQLLGWKYVLAHEKNEIYKEGKFVLERWTIVDNEEEELNSDAQAGSQAGSSDTENA